MRLRDAEVETLKKTLHTLAPDAEIYLFGSRTDDHARGGDIDLLIVSPNITRSDIRRLRIDFFEKFGEQKVDIIVDDGKFADPFHKLIREKAVAL